MELDLDVGRVCSQCGEEKPLDEFNLEPTSRGGRRRQCKTCQREYARDYWQRHPRKADPEWRRGRDAQWRRRAYGITDEVYSEMLARQGGRCAICRGVDRKRALGVDHDHATGRVRGLLCMNCNLTLGKVKDDPKTLATMIAYLEES